MTIDGVPLRARGDIVCVCTVRPMPRLSVSVRTVVYTTIDRNAFRTDPFKYDNALLCSCSVVRTNRKRRAGVSATLRREKSIERCAIVQTVLLRVVQRNERKHMRRVREKKQHALVASCIVGGLDVRRALRRLG